MKTLLALLLTLGLPAWLGAQSSAAPASPHEMAAVDQFLALDDHALDELLAAITRIRAMSPEERAALRQEIARFRALPDAQRQQLRQGWGGGLGASEQDQWRRLMQSASPERRAEIHARLQALPPAERAAYRQQLLGVQRQASPPPQE
jgi:hypothetical protein